MIKRLDDPETGPRIKREVQRDIDRTADGAAVFIARYKPRPDWVGKNLVIALKYGPARERSIAGLKRVSKPGLRVYAKKDNLPRVLGGLGIAIISTSGGLMTDKQAVKRGVGGEVLAYVW